MSPEPFPTLRFLSTRFTALLLFQKEIRWRRLPEVSRALREIIRDMRLPLAIRRDMLEGIGEILREVNRWGEKHAEMFDVSADMDATAEGAERRPQRRRGRGVGASGGAEAPAPSSSSTTAQIPHAHRSEHLRTFYYCIQWIPGSYEIDDLATAREIISRECRRWPQMHFQFAAAYALERDLEDDFLFDRHRLATFRKRLCEHPVYDFWLAVLRGGCSSWEYMFNMDNRPPNQRLMLAFRFAITHGFAELTRFLWRRTAPQHREYIGLLQWRAMCFRARSRETMRFVCSELCLVNPVYVARLTWTTFYDALYKSINEEETDPVVERKNLKKLEFLLDNSCSVLRKRLLCMENFRALKDAFRYNQPEMFALLLEKLSDEQLPLARERIDRIHDRKKSVHGGALQQLVLRRQQTIE